MTGSRSGNGPKLASKSTSQRKSRHLFDHWEYVRRRLESADRLALFLDFDGTITPLRPKPSDVKLKPSTRAVLRRLARHPKITLCFISGRRHAQLKNLVNVRGAHYVGLHGWERDAGAKSTIALPRLLAEARRVLIERLAGLPRVRVGDKGPCFDVHYHGASEATIRKARAIVYGVFRPLKAHARLIKGRDVWEFLPKEFEGKGGAVRDLLAEIPGPVLPVYIGDDTTDEFGFRAIPNGLTIRVGKPRRTRARYELRNPEEVITFLQKVEVEIE
jgi:trehalose 6-phosphate phosphatase